MCNICTHFETEIFHITTTEIGTFVSGLYSLGKPHSTLNKMLTACLSVRS